MLDTRTEIEQQKRIREHAKDCYAAFKCESCGCERRNFIACIVHAGNPAHMASVKVREVKLLERIALALERLANG